MRSLGKFFGLAGARVGFVMAQAELLQRLQAALGPWTIAHPARWLATQALQDSAWQAYSRVQLKQSTQRLADLLQQHELTVHGRTALFHWLMTPRAAALYQHLAQYGILTRLFTEPVSLRIGLPAKEADWQRLQQGLSTWQR
jgi:cobalamin biosynthetic protein CobC